MLSLGDRTLILLTLKPTGNTSQPFSGSLSRPQHFQTGDAVSFSHINGAVEIEPITASEWKDGSLSITVENPADKSDKDSYLLSLKDDEHALLQLVGVPLPPISLVRSNRPAAVFTDWDPDRTYSPDDDAPSNAEMKRIFEEDQKVRQPGFKSIGPQSANPMPSVDKPHSNFLVLEPFIQEKILRGQPSYSSTALFRTTICLLILSQ